MNMHPIVVHFPIALLIVYTGIEVISLFSPKRSERLSTTKLVCLWIGVLGSFAALSSGEVAQDMLGRSQLIHTHEEWAEKSHALYVILALFYVVKTFFAERFGLGKLLMQGRIKRIVALLALVGVGILTIVGALGGAISRGTGSGDPVSDWAVKTFVGEERGSVEQEQKRGNLPASRQGEEENEGQQGDTKSLPVVSTGSAGLLSYTEDQVKEHSEEASCWTSINGIVYDLTAFINQHPGGDRNILKLCGKDGTEAFTRKHGGQEKPEMTLKGFEIGVLAE